MCDVALSPSTFSPSSGGSFQTTPSPTGYGQTPSPVAFSPMTPGVPYTPQTPGAGNCCNTTLYPSCSCKIVILLLIVNRNYFASKEHLIVLSIVTGVIVD